MAPESHSVLQRRTSRLPLLVGALLLVTALVAALALAGFLWLATADYASIFASAVDFFNNLSTHVPAA